jgi:hypothetical protein
MSKTCEATRADHRPCTTHVVGDGRFCFAHSPELVAKRDAARRRGGANRATRVRLAKLMPLHLIPVFETLRGVLDDVVADRIEPKNAAAAASVARAMVTVLQHGEVEERLRKLEEHAS